MLKSGDVSRYLVIAILALSARADAQPEHVVLVSIDGLAAYELDAVEFHPYPALHSGWFGKNQKGNDKPTEP